LTKRPIFQVFTYPFKVIFSPFKAFKEISQNPDVKGVVLIVGLVLLATGGTYFAHSSKVFLGISERQPVSPTLHTVPDAYVYETAFGNYTFESSQPYVMNYTFFDKTPLIELSFFWVNTTELLTPVMPVVTIANDTFYQTIVKLNQSTTEVGNLTLTIKFYSDKSPTISTVLTKTAQWDLGNFTINWLIRSPYTYLSNITTAIDLTSIATLSLLETNVDRAELGNTASPNNWMRSILMNWSEYGNATLYGGHDTHFIDSGSWLDVVFNVNDAEINATTVGLTYTSILATNLFGGILLGVLTDTGIFFFINWLIYAGVLLLVMRVFGQKGGSWRPFFVLVGYAFSIMIIQSAVTALLIATLPEIHFTNMSTWPPSTLNEAAIASDKVQETWAPIPAFQAIAYLNFYINIFDVWLLILSAIVVHTFGEIVWSKTIMISLTAFLIRLFLRLFVGF